MAWLLSAVDVVLVGVVAWVGTRAVPCNCECHQLDFWCEECHE